MSLEDIGRRYIGLKRRQAALADKEQALKDEMEAVLGELDADTLLFGKVKATRVAPKARKSFDLKAFQEEHPQIHRRFVKEGKQPKPYLKISVNAI